MLGGLLWWGRSCAAAEFVLDIVIDRAREFKMVLALVELPEGVCNGPDD